MKEPLLISGFSFVRNGDKLGYPVAESIRSILPICDEFIIAVGKGDSGDSTRSLITAINDPKIKIIDTAWENFEGSKGRIYSQQTNIALAACRFRTWLEQHVFDGSQPWGFRTCKVLRGRKYRFNGST
jgi:hypothetical protein